MPDYTRSVGCACCGKVATVDRGGGVHYKREIHESCRTSCECGGIACATYNDSNYTRVLCSGVDTI